MKWRNYAALLEIGASPIEVDAPPSHSLFVSSSCFTLLINKRIFFHLSTTLYPTDRLTSSASSASSRFLSLARVGLDFEVSTKILGSRTITLEIHEVRAGRHDSAPKSDWVDIRDTQNILRMNNNSQLLLCFLLYGLDYFCLSL